MGVWGAAGNRPPTSPPSVVTATRTPKAMSNPMVQRVCGAHPFVLKLLPKGGLKPPFNQGHRTRTFGAQARGLWLEYPGVFGGFGAIGAIAYQ